MAATKRSSKKQSSSRAQKPSTNKRGNRRWVAGVKTVSTFPPKVHERRSHHRQVTRSSDRVSPKGPGSGMRMLTYFMNRAGGGLRPSGRKLLERAKRMLWQQAGPRPTNARERPDRRSKL